MRPWLQPSRAQMQKPRGKCLLPLWSLPGPECPFHRPRAAQRAYWTRSGVRTAGQNCSSTNWHKRPTEGIFLSLSTSRVGRGRGCKVERRSEQGSELQPQYAPLSIAARTALTHLAQSTFNKSCTFFRSVFQWAMMTWLTRIMMTSMMTLLTHTMQSLLTSECPSCCSLAPFCKTLQCRAPCQGLLVVAKPRDLGNEKSEKFIFSKISGVIRPWNWSTRAQTADPGMPDNLSQKFSFTVNLDILPDQFYIKDVN